VSGSTALTLRVLPPFGFGDILFCHEQFKYEINIKPVYTFFPTLSITLTTNL
jgi:hypothetical protein